MHTRRSLPTLLVLVIAILVHSAGFAADKNGVSPQAISLPSGPGSIQGLGESFQPQLNTGSGSYAVPLVLPKGTAGHTPSLTLQYNTGSSNGCLGMAEHYRTGPDQTVERPAIGRRSSECQVDCVNLLIPGPVTLVVPTPLDTGVEMPRIDELLVRFVVAVQFLGTEVIVDTVITGCRHGLFQIADERRRR